MKYDIDFFNKNGYLLLEDFFPKNEVNLILNDAKNVFLKQFIEKGYTVKSKLEDITESSFNSFMYRLFEEDFECLSNCGKQVQHLISLHLLSLNKKIIELLHEVGISSPVVSTRPVLFFNHPKLAKKKVFHKVAAHQDWRSMQGSLNSVVIWIPLLDINKDLGALEVLPGSHLQGLRTDHLENGFGMVKLDNEEEDALASIEVKAGDILLFSSFLIHQSGNNITDKPRWSCHFRYNDLDDSSFLKRKYAHPYIYKPIEELITKNFPSSNDIAKIYSR
ncbi:phytanoyl-CoA dioxygenase family protein [Marixanthomonas ophiurae]|uniref:Phytanoyl-CoA dioxygenase n=1 Tax=Marixanthomonas ophiurae TaxID=387659 RepID=A0A3E1QD25_9FLAO|nr:phytanoyl-CoA dioxygenase family protein [Marixanthomonas ophiurae]RFN60043.1 phytanoyl-CoA dioxygenase [Marixanthomonas ophiurae]